MSVNPFRADPTVVKRLSGQQGDSVRAAAMASMAPGHIIPGARVAQIVQDFGLTGPDDLMLHLIPAAQTLAQPPISGFFVGAIGQETSGDLILGCNLEFPGTHLGLTVHGEGFVMTRAFQLGRTITALALGEAHPCAHCRQYIAEFATSRDMILIDPLGHRLRMADLYPWPFDAEYLGQTGCFPGSINFPHLRRMNAAPALLFDAGQRAYAPYSGCPGAVMLEMHDGTQFTGTSIESVAFNPTIQPMQSALIAAIAAGYAAKDISKAWLGTVKGGNADYMRTTQELLDAIAPTATLTLCHWTAIPPPEPPE